MTQDVTEDNERIVGRAAVGHGAILIVIGLGIASHAIFEWRWITSLVDRLRQLEERAARRVMAPGRPVAFWR
jgi:hypothetical protein